MIDYSWLILLEAIPRSELEKYPALQSQFVDGDELWKFECSESLKHPLGGCSGVALKRGEQVVAHVATGQIFTY